MSGNFVVAGDGKRQRVEVLVGDIVSGITTYLTGAKARREERERWQRDWDCRQRLAALASAREERESRPCEFLKRFVAVSTEADELNRSWRGYASVCRNALPASWRA